MSEDYYIDIVNVTTLFNHLMSQTDFIKMLVIMLDNTTYTSLILTELGKIAPSLKMAYNKINKIWHLLQTIGKEANRKDKGKGKEVLLTKADKGKGVQAQNCGYCNGKHACDNCTECNAKLKAQGDCPDCGKRSHL